MFGSCASKALYAPKVLRPAACRVGSESLQSHPTLLMNRQLAPTAKPDGICQIEVRICRQRGLTVWQVEPNKPTQLYVGSPGSGVVVVLSSNDPFKLNR